MIGRAVVVSGCRSTNPNPNYGHEVVGEGECLGVRWWEKEAVWTKRTGAGGGGGAHVAQGKSGGGLTWSCARALYGSSWRSGRSARTPEEEAALMSLREEEGGATLVRCMRAGSHRGGLVRCERRRTNRKSPLSEDRISEQETTA
jgi:hypothetical protein